MIVPHLGSDAVLSVSSSLGTSRSRMRRFLIAVLLAALSIFLACTSAAPVPPVSAVASGPWGDTFLPAHRETPNAACRTNKGFGCYGQSTTDASEFCTF